MELPFAATEFFADGSYNFEGSKRSAQEMIDYYTSLCDAFPLVSIEDPLSEDDLVQILTEPRDALTRQYQELFRLSNVKLSFTDKALRDTARLAVRRGTGGCGAANGRRTPPIQRPCGALGVVSPMA